MSVHRYLSDRVSYGKRSYNGRNDSGNQFNSVCTVIHYAFIEGSSHDRSPVERDTLVGAVGNGRQSWRRTLPGE